MKQNDWLVPASECPKCHVVQDAAGAQPGESFPRPPVAGDLTICFSCVALLAYDDKLHLRIPTVADLRAWEKQPGLLESAEAVQAQVRRFLALKKERRIGARN